MKAISTLLALFTAGYLRLFLTVITASSATARVIENVELSSEEAVPSGGQERSEAVLQDVPGLEEDEWIFDSYAFTNEDKYGGVGEVIGNGRTTGVMIIAFRRSDTNFVPAGQPRTLAEADQLFLSLRIQGHRLNKRSVFESFPDNPFEPDRLTRIIARSVLGKIIYVGTESFIHPLRRMLDGDFSPLGLFTGFELLGLGKAFVQFCRLGIRA